MIDTRGLASYELYFAGFNEARESGMSEEDAVAHGTRVEFGEIELGTLKEEATA